MAHRGIGPISNFLSCGGADRGLSQVEMAHQFGIDRGHISEMENGKKNACLPLLEVLSRGFGISISELMKGI
jgi:transcriptional regulator with XRE-family HTH domain